jgi:hypothetical protein
MNLVFRQKLRLVKENVMTYTKANKYVIKRIFRYNIVICKKASAVRKNKINL